MICYLVRHGKDDDTLRGGWSDAPLTEEGISQIHQLVQRLVADPSMNIGRIYSSDLPRARQTAELFSKAFGLMVEELPDFRETNNGILAGMKNTVAAERYPGLYWSSLGWDERYPGGESPHEFFDRIAKAWYGFKTMLGKLDSNVILVTHGGVINVIQCIENGIPYTNKSNPYPIRHGEMVGIQL
jgi:probable phosphoglycerate mutase